MKTDGSDMNEKGKSLERSPVQNLKDLLNSDHVKNHFIKIIGEKAPAFIASVLNATQKNPDLVKCDNNSILSSAVVAATLDLPIDSNLGFAAIVPYKTKVFDKIKKEEREVSIAQFQIMYKGFIQLALRSGQYKTINVSPIFEDEFESYDIITGDVIIHPVSGGYREQENLEKIVGYAAFFRLTNGFERTEYWSLSRLKAHGERFSKSYKNANGIWKKHPHAMYAKTVLKNTISKWGILSVTMQNAISVDQSALKDWKKPIDNENINYIDSGPLEDGIDAGLSEGQDANAIENEETKAEKTSKEAHDKNIDNSSHGNYAQKDDGKPDSAETREAETHPGSNNNGGVKQGLFPKDEEEALEEQYRQQQANGRYPDFH